MKKLIIFFVFLSLISLVDSCQTKIEKARPNIIFILADDLKSDAIGIAGNPVIKTPNIDALANEGVYFPNTFISSAICMPSRASIMTGMYEKNHHCNFGHDGLKTKFWELSYPILLRQSGYNTGFIGKFGFGVSDVPSDWEYHSEDKLPAKDFDYWKGFPGQGNYFPKGKDGKHLTNLNSEYALDFLNNYDQSKDQPFCLSISFKAPHGPMTPDPVYDKLFVNQELSKPNTYDSIYYNRLPEAVKKSWGHNGYFSLYLNTPEKFQSYVKRYYRLITGVDDALGKIRKELERLNLSENTIIIFTSDNGYFTGEHLMGGKVLMYEESIKVPLIIFDPNSAVKNKGITNDNLISNVDFAPTILRFAGLDIPEQMDGMDISSLFQEREDTWREMVFCENNFSQGTEISVGPYDKDGKTNWRNQYYPKSWCLRSNEFKYISYWEEKNQTEELYDMVSDVFEKNNLISNSTYENIVKSFREKLKQELSNN